MSWIPEPTELPTRAAELYAQDLAGDGYVANYTRLFAHRPAVMDAWKALNGAVKGSMDQRRYELATLAAALRLRSSYCSLAHGRLLADRYVAADDVRAAAQGEPTATLDDVDRAVMRLADRVAAGGADVSEDDWGELRDLGVPDPEILDVVLAAAARCFFSTVLDATGTQPDAAYRSLDEALQQALTVGRPIAPA